MFDIPHKFEYVPITDLLKSTSARVSQFSEAAGRYVRVEYDIECGVARINYMLLETVILELAGILIELLGKGQETVLRILGRRNEPLRLSARVPFNDVNDEKRLERAVKLVKCSVASLGGDAAMLFEDGSFTADVRIPVSLSNLFSRVNKKASVSRASKGYDRIFSSSAENEFAVRSRLKTYSVSCSMTLANLILEPIARRISSL